MLCYKNESFFGNYWIGYIQFATPCDGNEECVDGLDENWCIFSKLVLPFLLFGTGLILILSLVWYLNKHVNKRIQEVMKQPEYPTSSRSLRLIQVAILTENENQAEIIKIFIKEWNVRKSCAMCCLKVIPCFIPFSMYILNILMIYVHLELTGP